MGALKPYKANTKDVEILPKSVSTSSSNSLPTPKFFIFGICIAGLAVIIVAAVYYLVPFTHKESRQHEVSYTSSTIEDSTLELGERQIRQSGDKGINETEFKVRRTLAGKTLSTDKVGERTVKAPSKETVAIGTKKYQYMWCSNGGYRYFSNEEFKNPITGFTHKSADFCAQNNVGHMTNLADAAPAQAAPPVYQRSAPTYTPPRTCNTQYHTYGGYFDPTATTTCY